MAKRRLPIGIQTFRSRKTRTVTAFEAADA